MKNRSKIVRTVSLLVFSFGIFLALFVAGAIIWGDFEAALFDPGIKADSKLREFECPVAITNNEVGEISATLENSIDRDRDFYVRTHISEGYVILKREINQLVPVPAQGKETISWEIYPEDAVYRRLVLSRVYVNALYPTPSQGNSCGVLVIDFPGITGNQLFSLLVIVSLAASIGGAYSWRKADPNTQRRNASSMGAALIGLILIVYFTMIIGYFGFWLFGVVFLAICVLMVGVIFGRYMLAL